MLFSGPWRRSTSRIRGSAPWRRRPRFLAVAHARERAELPAVVARRHAANGARARAHDQRLGRRTAVALVADPLEHVPVGHACGREEDIVPGDEVVAGQHPLEVIAGGDRGLALLVVARPEPAEQLAADALDGGCRDDSLR